MKRIRRLRDRWLAHHHSNECFRGCGRCCCQPVGTLLVEGCDIATGLDDFQLSAILVDVKKGRARRPCVFLDEAGVCQIYARRPISCSTMFPNGKCSETAQSIDCREPVHAARALDIKFARRIGFEWPGPLLLPAAVAIGVQLLLGDRDIVVERGWMAMPEENRQRLLGGAA
jgi:Fe-S-cluster containining protein